MTFLQFATGTLKLELTPAWRVLLLICIDGVQPSDLEGDDRELARTLLGDVDEVPALARRLLVWIFGRESWKTTISAAIALHSMLTADLAKTGPGDVPTFMIIAPDRKTAGVAIRIALGLARTNPQIARLIENETAEGFTIRRPHDRRVVAFESFAVSRAGANLRGRSILGAILDESMFFTSDTEGDYVKNDRDVYRAIVPRLMRGGRIIFISTPWPTETLTGEFFAVNYGHPMTAIAARAATLVMRNNDPELAERIDSERAADPDNTARERDADMDVTSGGGAYFDPSAIDRSVDPKLPLVIPRPAQRGVIAAAIDGGFRSDSSALAIVFRLGEGFALLALDELRPAKGAPLKPSEVVASFAEMIAPYGARRVASDSFYVEAVREELAKHSLSLVELPAGQTGKIEQYATVRRIFHEGRIVLPNHPRLVSQLKAIRSRPTTGGGLQITAPRRGGHGDLVSALVGAIWLAEQSGAPRTGDAIKTYTGGARDAASADVWAGGSFSGKWGTGTKGW